MAGTEEMFHRKVQTRLADQYLRTVELKEEGSRCKQFNQEMTRTCRRVRLSSSTLQNLLWLIISIAVFYITDFHEVVLHDPRISSVWFTLGISLIGLTVVIAIFLTVWLSLVQRVSSEDWEKRHPAAIPVATGSFIIGSLCILKSLWPVWGLLTPFIQLTLFMGIIALISICG